MSYICECGNKDEFLEAFDIAVDVVDVDGHFIRSESRNVAFYICPECDREIHYQVFHRNVNSTTSNTPNTN